MIDLEDGCTVRRHIDHIKFRPTTSKATSSTQIDWMDIPDLPPSTPEAEDQAPDTEAPLTLRHSTRATHLPDCYM